jgi:hypothetical protein
MTYTSDSTREAVMAAICQAIQISTTLMLLGKQSISIQLQTMKHGSSYPKILIVN